MSASDNTSFLPDMNRISIFDRGSFSHDKADAFGVHLPSIQWVPRALSRKEKGKYVNVEIRTAHYETSLKIRGV
jgi:hypothetical protein